MRKILTTLISVALVAVFSFQAMPVLAADPAPISRNELLGSWKGTVKITTNYSQSDNTVWITSEEAKEHRATFYEPSGAEAPKDSLYLAGPHDDGSLYVTVDAQGMFDGYTTQVIEYDDRLVEMEYFYSGKITRQGDELLMVLEVRVDSVMTKYRNSETVENSFTYTYTMNPINYSSSTITPPATIEEPVDYGTGVEKARISFIQGKAHIQRNARLIPATVGESLMAGDTLVCEEGEIIIAGAESGTLKIVENTRFQLPEEVGVKKTPPSSIAKILGDIWMKTKELLGGESFEVKTPTGACGVRG